MGRSSCLGASFMWGKLSWGELSLGRVVRICHVSTVMLTFRVKSIPGDDQKMIDSLTQYQKIGTIHQENMSMKCLPPYTPLL